MFPKERTAYGMIKEIIQRNIEQGSLAEGTILLEGPIAALFGSSRSPVKQALAQLADEGLVRRFEGRGMVVGRASAPLRRVPITAETLNLEPGAAERPKVWTWQKLYDEVERELISRSVFGRFRVNELALARHFGVGRTVARDVLIQAQSVGIVVKGEKAHWYIVPLDRKRLDDLYALRALLEPALLASAVDAIPASVVKAMIERLHRAMRAYPDIESAALDALETDIHVSCLAFGTNAEIAESLKRTRCILISGKHLLGAEVAFPESDPFMQEHLEILTAIAARDGAAAARAMVAHLAVSRTKVADRLEAFCASYATAPAPYII